MGGGSSHIALLTSIVLAFILFFYIFSLGSLVKPTVYVIQDRISVYRLFYEYLLGKYLSQVAITLGTVIWLTLSLRGKIRAATIGVYSSIVLTAVLSKSEVLLDIAALISVPLILSFFLLALFTSKLNLKMNDSSLATTYLSLVVIGASSISLFISSLAVLHVSLWGLRLKDYAYIVFILFSSVSPVLLILLVFALPIKLLTKRLVNKISAIESHLPPYNLKTKTKIFYLCFFMGLSIILVHVPYQQSLNDTTHTIGADTRNYVRFINTLEKSGDTSVLLKQAFISISGGDRPLSLLFLLSIVEISPYDHAFTIDRMPLILSPILVLVVFFLTKQLTSNDISSLLASFLTIVSFHVLVGTYAGFYANWMALIVGYLSIVFGFKCLKEPSKSKLILFSALTVVTLFCHTYTWTILTIVTIVFLCAALKLNYYPKRRILLLLLFVLASVAVDLSRIALTGAASGIERDISLAEQQQAGVGQFNQRWYNLISTTHYHYGSLFGNFIFFALGLYWLFKCKIREPYNIFLMIFLSIGMIPLFLGDWVVQSRVLYNIPFQIPTAIGLTFLLTRKKPGPLMLIAICIWLMAFSVRAVSNF
jgi:hypothetical protein